MATTIEVNFSAPTRRINTKLQHHSIVPTAPSPRHAGRPIKLAFLACCRDRSKIEAVWTRVAGSSGRRHATHHGVRWVLLGGPCRVLGWRWAGATTSCYGEYKKSTMKILSASQKHRSSQKLSRSSRRARGTVLSIHMITVGVRLDEDDENREQYKMEMLLELDLRS